MVGSQPRAKRYTEFRIGPKGEIQHQVHIKGAGQAACADGIRPVLPKSPAELNHEMIFRGHLHRTYQPYVP